jgi:thiamine pyrophosphokinase
MDSTNIVYLLESQKYQTSDQDNQGLILTCNLQIFSLMKHLAIHYRHRIIFNDRFHGPSCGLLPLGGKVRNIWTKGLKWDLDGQSMQMGGLVSSSNRKKNIGSEIFVDYSKTESNDQPNFEKILFQELSNYSPDIFVETSDDIVWMCEWHF